MKKSTPLPPVIWILGLLLASLFVLWPLAKPGFFISDDGEWMIIRLSAFFQSLREGQFPVRFLGRLNHSYGYPVSNFLYPGFLYIGSFIHAIGFSFSDTVKIILGGSVVAGTLFTFFWLRTFFGVLPSVMGSLAYLFAPYLAFDIYTRGSVGEVLAMSAAAGALYSIDAGKRWLLPLAIGLLVVSHNSLAILFVVFVAGYILVRRRREMVVPLILGLGLATFFWFPALMERQYVLFDTVAVANPATYFVGVRQAYLLGFVGMLSFGILLFVRKRHPYTMFFMFMFGLSVFLATSASRVIWYLPLLGQLFQFPYRFLSVGILCGAFTTAAAVDYAKKRAYLLGVLFILLWGVPLWRITSHVDTIVRSSGYYTTNEATTTVADEYMPRWVRDTPRERTSVRMQFYNGRGTIDVVSASTQHICADIHASEDSILQINTVYYPGWIVAIDQAAVPIDYRNPQGIMRVAVASGRHTIDVQFRETPLRLAADVVSGLSILLYAVFIVWGYTGRPYGKKLRIKKS